MSTALRLGIFILAALVIFGAGVFWIGDRQFLFASTYTLNAEFTNVAGLVEGAPVRVGGVPQGTVHHIMLPQRSDQKVRVEMNLKPSTRNVVKKDSVASIRTEGLVGDQFVEISFGSPGGAAVKEGDVISTEPPLQLSDLLKKTNGILDSAREAVENVSDSAANLESITGKVNQGRGSVGAFLNDRSVYQQANEAVANLKDDTEALKHNFFLRGFFKKRGYENESDLTRNAIPRLPAVSPVQRFTAPGAKLFDKPDNARVKRGKLLDEAGKFLQNGSYGLAVIQAQMDAKGDTGKQLELSQARAFTARAYLVQNFKLDDTKLKTIGTGKSDNAPEGGEVNVLVYPSGVTPPAAKEGKDASEKSRPVR